MARFDCRFFCVLCLVVCFLGAVPAAAGGVVVSPAKIVAEVREGSKLPPITIYNGSKERIIVEVSIGAGGHDLWGIPTMVSELDPDDPKSPLAVRPTQFTLGPGKSQTVAARVVQPVNGGLYPIIYFSVREAGAEAGSVQAQRRLAVLTLLTESHGSVPTPVVENIFLSQSERGAPVRFISVVSNPGPRHLTISGQMTISDAAHEENARLFFSPVTILPGCRRQVEVVWRPESLPAGFYQGELALRVEGGQTVQQAFPILAVRPYEIAQPALETGGWRAQLAPLSGELVLAGIVRNSGNVPLAPEVAVEVGGCQSKPMPVAVGTLEPGETRSVEIPLPNGLERGVYDLQVLVAANTFGGLIEQAVDYKLQVEAADVVALSPVSP